MCVVMLHTLHSVGGKVCCDLTYFALCGCEGRVVMLHILHCVGGKVCCDVTYSAL